MQTIKEYLEPLGLIYYGFLALPLLMFPIVYLPLKEQMKSGSGMQVEILIWIGGMLPFVALFAGWHRYRRSLVSISKQWAWEIKLQAHRKASIQFYGFGLISGLLSVALLWITRHQLFVAVYPILLLIISFFRPTGQRMKRELPLSEKELTMFNDQRYEI